MKIIIKVILFGLTGIMMAACKYDPNEGFDMTSPQAKIAVDTFEVHRGATVELKATLTDASGLLSCTLSYSAWNVTNEVQLQNSGFPKKYEYSFVVTVPDDAEYSWIEDYQNNDGSIFKITQTYHKISLTFYDAVKNKNVVNFYIKVLP